MNVCLVRMKWWTNIVPASGADRTFILPDKDRRLQKKFWYRTRRKKQDYGLFSHFQSAVTGECHKTIVSYLPLPLIMDLPGAPTLQQALLSWWVFCTRYSGTKLTPRWIGGGGSIAWRSRSPDLVLFKYFPVWIGEKFCIFWREHILNEYYGKY